MGESDLSHGHANQSKLKPALVVASYRGPLSRPLLEMSAVASFGVGDLLILLPHRIREQALEGQRAFQGLRAGRTAGGMVALNGIQMPGINQQLATK